MPDKPNDSRLRVIGVVVINHQRGGLGQASTLEQKIQGQPLLDLTLARLKQMKQLDDTIMLEQQEKPQLTDAVIASRKWSTNNWRGGLGGTTVFDELLPLDQAVDVLRQKRAGSGYFVRGDWCLHDPGLGDAVVEHHRSKADKLKMCFTQAPPGLCGVVLHVETLAAMVGQNATFGNLLGYNPQYARVDPMLLEPNVPIDVHIRNTARRFIYDTHHSRQMIEHVANELSENFAHADAMTVARLWREAEALGVCAAPPREIDIELTPRWVDDQERVDLDESSRSRILLPQAHARFDRQDMSLKTAERIANELASRSDVHDVVVMLGGLGDALCHPQWHKIVELIDQSGVSAIGIRTSLLHDETILAALLEAPIELIQVDLHADTEATYRTVMGSRRFGEVWSNAQWFLKNRGARNLPQMVFTMDKTVDNLSDLETFYDRWMTVAGSVVLQSPRTGRGVDEQGQGYDLMRDLSPVNMTPPKRQPCRQLGRRQTILSDGVKALCDQDWLGVGYENPKAMCENCRSWHRL